MKKSVNILGISLLVILFTGIIFKRMHYPGAGVLTTLGIFLFIAVYLPSFIVSLSKQMKSEGASVNRLLLIIGTPGLVILSFGILAKMMHWPGAYFSLWGGIGLVSLALLLYLIINRKSNEKISMISVMIVIILLGSFSFNMFRMGNIRSMGDAYDINGASFSETSRIFWKECEKQMNEKVIEDTILLAPPIRNELMQLHSLVQETDLVIGNILEKIRIAENSSMSIESPGERADMMSESMKVIILGDEGMNALDRKISAYKSFIGSMTGINPDEKNSLIANLVYPFENQDSGLLFKYLGIYSLAPEVCENTLLLWKSRIWETEYQLTDLVVNK